MVENKKPDKYNAVWVSHSSINDFLKCPRAYFLRSIYRNPRGKKINIVNSHLSLGIAVHETLEGLLNYKAQDRFAVPLLDTFEKNIIFFKIQALKNLIITAKNQ